MSGAESNNRDRTWWIWWVLCVVWACGVLVISSIRGDYLPRLDIPSRFLGIGMDKWAHFALFLVGGFLLTAALRKTFEWRWQRVFMVAICALALFGMADEFRQLFTPRRSGADLGDWMADTLGGATGWLLMYLAYGTRLFRKRSTTGLVASTGNPPA